MCRTYAVYVSIDRARALRKVCPTDLLRFGTRQARVAHAVPMDACPVRKRGLEIFEISYQENPDRPRGSTAPCPVVRSITMVDYEKIRVLMKEPVTMRFVASLGLREQQSAFSTIARICNRFNTLLLRQTIYLRRSIFVENWVKLPVSISFYAKYATFV